MKKRTTAVSALALTLFFSISTVGPAQADTTIALGAKNCASAPVYVAVKSYSQIVVTHTIYQSPSVAYSKKYLAQVPIEIKTKSPYVASSAAYVITANSSATWSASTYCQGPI